MIDTTNTPAEGLTDPREMRKVLQEAARGFARVDGKPIGKFFLPPSGCLIRSALHAVHYGGWSGEDTMTVLAYHALLLYEGAYDRLLDVARVTPSAALLSAAEGAIEAAAALEVPR